MAQSEFIDLYELLHLPVESDVATVRKRLSEVYLEAQQNLDHRNAQKRLQYQQMYEIILPQARHLLLDAARRAEYDRYLFAYRSGQPLQKVEARPINQDDHASGFSEIPEMLVAEEKVDPEVLAAQREELWNKWKSGLDLSDPEPTTPAAKPAAAATASQKPAPRAGGGSAPLTPAAKVGHQPLDRPGTYVASAQRRSAAEIAAAEEAEAQQKQEFERQRAAHREEMVQNLSQTTILVWTFGVGAATLLGLSVIIFVLDNYMAGNGNYPILSLERGMFMGVCFLLALLLAGLGAYFGARKGRERITTELSRLSYEELQRRTR